MRGIVLSLMLLPGMAIAQTDDRTFLTAFLEDNLSDAGRKVTITGFEGALSSRASVAEMTIADAEGVWITLRDVSLDWTRSDLLRGRVSVNALTAGEIILDRAPVSEAGLPSPEARGFSLPELPVSVDIGKIAADRIVLGEAVLGTALEGRLEAALSLESGEGTGNLVLERTDSGPEGRISLTGSYGNASQTLSLELSAVEAAGGIATDLLGIPGSPAVDLSIVGNGTLPDFVADVRLASDGADRLTGQVVLAGTEAGAQSFTADLSGDLAPLFLPRYAAFFGPEVSLQAAGSRTANGRLDLQQFQVTTQSLKLDGALAIAADGLPERFALSGTLAAPDGSPVLLPTSGDADMRVAQASVDLTYDHQSDDGWSLKALLSGLDHGDFDADQITLTGSGRIARGPAGAGPVVGGTIRVDARGLAPTDPDLAKALGDQVTGDAKFFWRQGDVLRLPRFAVTGSGYGVEAKGLIGGVLLGFPVSGTASIRADDLTRFAPLSGRPLSGAITGDLRGGGTLLAGSFDVSAGLVAQNLTVGVAEADNLLRGPTTIDLSIRRDETGTLLRSLDLQARTLSLKAQGTVATAGSDLTADLNFAELSVLGGPYRGQLVGKAALTGTFDNANLTLDADGTGLAIGQAEVDTLLAGASRLSLDAVVADNAVDLRAFRITAATLEATAQGKISADATDVKATVNMSNLAALGGTYRGALTALAGFTGSATDGVLTVEGAGTNLGVGVSELDRLLAGKTDLSATLAVKDGIARIEAAQIRNPQLSAAASGSAENLALEARLVNLALILPDFPGPVSVSGTAAAIGSDYRVDLTGTGPGQIAARISGTIAANMQRANLIIAGSAQAGLANVFLRPRSISGPVRFDLNLNGPLALSAVSGRVSLAGGRLSDPGLPFSLQDITAAADLSGGQARATYSMGLTTGGQIAGEGTVGLTAPYPANLRANLRQVVARDPRLYETRMNGDIAVDGPLTGGALISGQVLLNETELRIPSTGLGANGQLPGLEHLNEPGDVRATRVRAGLIDDGRGGTGAGSAARPFTLDLRISAPSRVFVRGRGLDAELGGELRLGGTTASILPSGGFELIRGRLDILGKRLVLSQARLQMEGSFDPRIDVLASTESDGITSSVQISGLASAPIVSFVSMPELPEEEVLSRLLFGRGLTQLSPLQAIQLAGAVATLAGRGGDGIISKLRQGFGLDDLDFETSDEGGTTLKAGKYLSRNLYTEVIVGDDGKSEIQLNLDVTKSVTIRGRVGADGNTGLGVFLEKDY